MELLRKRDREWVREQQRRYISRLRKGSRQGARSGGDRRRDNLLRGRVQRSLDDLLWLVKNWPPDQQNKVFTKDVLEEIARAMLASKYQREFDRDKARRELRQRSIAAALMEKSMAVLLQCFESRNAQGAPIYGPALQEMVTKETLRTALILNEVAGVAGVNIWDLSEPVQRSKPANNQQ